MTRERKIYKTTLLGSISNLLLVLFKLFAGIFGRSAAMIADAVHSLSDFVTDIIVIVFVGISSKPRDADHDFGHGKFETLATTIVGLILFGVGIGILCQAALAVANAVQGNPLPVPGTIALIAAAVSIVLKEILYQYTVRVGKKVGSNALIANAWHHRSDALSSVGAFVGIGGAILLGEKWAVLDPIAALVVSVFILRAAWQITKPCVEELLEKSLPREVEEKIAELLLEVEPGCRPHNLRTRRLGPGVAIEVHILLRPDMSVLESHQITQIMESRLRQHFKPHPAVISIHVEPIKTK